MPSPTLHENSTIIQRYFSGRPIGLKPYAWATFLSVSPRGLRLFRIRMNGSLDYLGFKVKNTSSTRPENETTPNDMAVIPPIRHVTAFDRGFDDKEDFRPAI